MSRLASVMMIALLLMPLASTAGSAVPVETPGVSTGSAGSHALPSILVADVELVDLAPPGDRYDEAEDAARATMLSQRIRSSVVSSKHYRVINRGEADRKPPHSYSNCTACFMDWARQRGADFVLVTSVQKESRLILAVNMALIDVAHPDKAAGGGSVELRGDTDETWLAGSRLMLDHALGVPLKP